MNQTTRRAYDSWRLPPDMGGQKTHLNLEGTLGELFETVTGTTPSKSKPEFYGDYMPFVKPPELNNCLIENSADGLSLLGVAEARVLPPDSVLVSCIGILGKLGLNTIPVAFNQQINAIKPNYEIAIPKFVFYYCMSDIFIEQMNRLASGTTVSLVNKSKFNSITISLPPLAEQERIVKLLEETFANTKIGKENTQLQIALYDSLEKSTLQQVFSGTL